MKPPFSILYLPFKHHLLRWYNATSQLDRETVLERVEWGECDVVEEVEEETDS